MFQKINYTPKTKPDWMLGGSIALVIVLLILLSFPISGSMRMSYKYHRYLQELADSFVYGEDNEVMKVSSTGKEEKAMSVPRDIATVLYTKIVDAGMGHPRSSIPDGPFEEAFTVDFGDGTSLLVRKVKIVEKARDNDTGVLFWYTRKDGTYFAYDTDKLQFEELARVLGWEL